MIGNTPIFKTEEPKDYTALLTSIDNKASNLALMKTELIAANTALTKVNADTTAIILKIASLISKFDLSIEELATIKNKIEAGNLSLAQLVALTTNFDANITTIKNTISSIKIDLEFIKEQIKEVIAYLQGILSSLNVTNSLLTNILNEFNLAQTFTTATKFNNSLNNFYAREKILFDNETGLEVYRSNEQTSDGAHWFEYFPWSPTGSLNIGWLDSTKEAAKKIDFRTWKATPNTSIVLKSCSTISLYACRGEFKIQGNNDFSQNIIASGVNSTDIFNAILISSDGNSSIINTATELPISFDSRANGFDLSLTNVITVTCIRAGELNIELYK
jgi:hypothetical protein